MDVLTLLLTLLITISVIVFYVYTHPQSLSAKNTSTTKLPEQSLNVKIDTYNINYTKKGSGPNLVLIHGFASSVYCWRHLIPYLQEYYTVYALDLVGFGQSSKAIHLEYDLDSQTDRIMKFLKTLEIDTPYVVGCSMGGALSFWLKNKYPNFINKTIAINPSLNPKIVPYGTNFFSLKVARLLLHNHLFKQIMKRVFNDKSLINKESIKRYREPYIGNDDALICLLKSLKTLKDSRLNKAMPSLTNQTLLLYSKKDRIIHYKLQKPFLKSNPGVTKVASLSGGHHLMEEKPRWTFEQIHRFFSSF